MAIKIARSNLKWHILFLVGILVLLSAVMSIRGGTDEKNATEYSKDSKYWDMVYADIVSIKPTSATVDPRKIAQYQTYKGFFCTCETVDGQTFKVYLTTSTYGLYIQNGSWLSKMPTEVKFDTPLHIIGRVTKMKNILTNTFDESLVFEIYKSDLKTK